MYRRQISDHLIPKASNSPVQVVYFNSDGLIGCTVIQRGMWQIVETVESYCYRFRDPLLRASLLVKLHDCFTCIVDKFLTISFQRHQTHTWDLKKFLIIMWDVKKIPLFWGIRKLSIILWLLKKISIILWHQKNSRLFSGIQKNSRLFLGSKKNLAYFVGSKKLSIILWDQKNFSIILWDL